MYYPGQSVSYVTELEHKRCARMHYPRTKSVLCNRTRAYKIRAHVLPRDMGVGGGGGGLASLKKAPFQKIKKCAIIVLRGLGGMVSRENFTNGAPYYILNASQQGHI